jgi:hypothetical protein
LFAIERPHEERQTGTLRRRELQAAQSRARSLAGETPMQALKAVQPRAEIVVKRDQESAAGACMRILDKPDPMAAIRILDQDMASVLGISVLDDWPQ